MFFYDILCGFESFQGKLEVSSDLCKKLYDKKKKKRIWAPKDDSFHSLARIYFFFID